MVTSGIAKGGPAMVGPCRPTKMLNVPCALPNPYILIEQSDILLKQSAGLHCTPGSLVIMATPLIEKQLNLHLYIFYTQYSIENKAF